jgi:2-oxo-4-hydroxy-4-carboxy--5-ureidoimidazoline (OHCU) decarboxylase
MTEDQRIAVLDAHPRIGADAASLSLRSRREQGASGDPATLSRLVDLNDAYETKFGFRFVVFVAGRSKEEIVPVLRARLANTREAELKTGLEEFLAISLDRLEHRR